LYSKGLYPPNDQRGVQSNVSMHIGQRGDAGAGLFGGPLAPHHCTYVSGTVRWRKSHRPK
jgi:hypothetical protein